MKQIVAVLLAAVFPMWLLAADRQQDERTRSGLSAADFSACIDGVDNHLYVLTNAHGLEACVTNYGARLVSLMVPDREGRLEDVVCGFPTLDGYTRHSQNFGATVGRYIGRILGARFTLDGEEFVLQAAANGHCAHGGTPNFGARMWRTLRSDSRSVTLVYVSPDGENGFPGRLEVRLTYTLTDADELAVSYEAVTDRPTVLNLTNHSFFNLSGCPDSSVEPQWMLVRADSITAYDDRKCVTGSYRSVTGTAFDFRRPRRIGEGIDDDDPQLKVTGGYDHCWTIGFTPRLDEPAAWVYDAGSGRRMEVFTTEPGLHIYTANGLKGVMTGKQGVAYPRRSAVCFETCHFQNSPNCPQFPSTVLRPDRVFRSRTVFRFSCPLSAEVGLPSSE